MHLTHIGCIFFFILPDSEEKARAYTTFHFYQSAQDIKSSTQVTVSMRGTYSGKGQHYKKNVTV